MRPQLELSAFWALWFQFTHPGRGATELLLKFEVFHEVSIHAPREGCDKLLNVDSTLYTMFQFTHPGRGATAPDCLPRRPILSFNSRTPGGVRRLLEEGIPFDRVFQFTHPGRGATLPKLEALAFSAFQFTHPGRGATPFRATPISFTSWFQFTHPGRGATNWGWYHQGRVLCFNSRTPGGVRRY